MTPQEQLAELYELKRYVESRTFQDNIIKPLRKRQDELHLNFFSDTIKEAWRKGGKYEGIKEFFSILKDIDNDIKNLKYELESQPDKTLSR